MSDKKYPYIGEAVTGNKYLMVSNELGVKIGGGIHTGLNGRMFKNITPEFLSNTWGIVESTEQAGFIRFMCENNDIKVNEYASQLDRYFAIYKGELLFFHNEYSVSRLGGKKITIPLPPKPSASKVNRDIERDIAPISTPEEDFEMNQIEKSNGPFKNINPDNTENLYVNLKSSTPTPNYVEVIFTNNTGLDLSFTTIQSTSGRTVEVTVVEDSAIEKPSNELSPFSKHLKKQQERMASELDAIKNNGDNLLFGGGDKVKVWPQVGDEVIFKSTKWKVAAKYNHMLMLVTLDDCGFALAGKNDCSKPKTPAEELRDDLMELTLKHMENNSHPSEANAYYLFGDLMDKYNITKKPQ
ncbi:MAG TPA: hypothetical protein VIC51_11105 [Psychromonas sp.]